MDAGTQHEPQQEPQQDPADDRIWSWDGLPGIPASAGALLTDPAGRLLLLKPTYKSGWTIPGGVMENDGETPWQACQREVLEETGIAVSSGRLVAVDTRPAKARRAMGLRFLFDCGRLDPVAIAGIVVQATEVSEFRFVEKELALSMLRPAVSRRVAQAWVAIATGRGCVYLEDGSPLTAQPD